MTGHPDSRESIASAMKSDIVPFSRRQTMLCLAYIAYTGMWGSAVNDPKALYSLFVRFLSELQPLNNRWQLIWGPALQSGWLSDANVIYAVADTLTTSRVAVVIRGTNPLSLYDMIHEVGDIFSQVPWTSGSTAAGRQPAIAGGVQNGLEILTSVKPVKDLPGEGLTLTEFLRHEHDRLKTPLEVHVTGHSLGATLASTLGLWLLEQLDSEASWDASRTSTVSATTFAGYTAGNPDFAEHSDTLFKGGCDRVFNPKDVVPNTYADQDMVKIDSIYQPLIPTSKLYSFGVALTRDSLKKKGLQYRQIEAKSVPLLGFIQPDHKDFVTQMLWQHVESYVELLGLAGQLNPLDLLKAHAGDTGNEGEERPNRNGAGMACGPVPYSCASVPR